VKTVNNFASQEWRTDSCTLHAYHFFYNIETFEIVYIEYRPAYMKPKVG